MYKMLVKQNIDDIKLYYSAATYGDDDNDFSDSEENCVMLACDKFKTWFDWLIWNLELICY